MKASPKLQILPGLKHSILLEAPDLIADRLLSFFTRPETAEEMQNG